MVLWNETETLIVNKIALSTILDPECQQIVNRVALALRPTVQPLPFDTTCPADCLCPACLDTTHFKAELAIEIEHGIIEALLSDPFLVAPCEQCGSMSDPCVCCL